MKLQRHNGSRWKTVTTAKVSDSRGHYRLSAKPAVGTHTYRVLRPGTEHTKSSASTSFIVTGDKCTALRTPPTTAVWFTDPKSKAAVSNVTSNIGALICGAAKDSSIDVALFFLDATSKEVEAILRPLELMHRFRGVNVRFLLERRDIPSGLGPSTRARLSRIGSIALCNAGCRNAGSQPGILHQKFVRISNTIWRRGTDPVLLASSANWSKRQLRAYWQSAILFANDPALTREFALRFDSMRVCATAPTGCKAWNAAAGHGIELNRNKVWVDKRSEARRGSAGRGTAVAFSPTDAGDPYLTALSGLKCTKAHHTVRLAMYVMTESRAKLLAGLLQKLHKAGCDVSVLVSVTGGSSTSKASIDQLEKLGVPVRCVALMHTKFTVIDAVRATGGKTTQSIWDGSRNLASTSLRYNDDATISMTVQQATGAYATDLRSMQKQYLSHWSKMASARTSCPTNATRSGLEYRSDAQAGIE